MDLSKDTPVVIAKLVWGSNEYKVLSSKKLVKIGRFSAKTKIDVDLGNSSFVSRVHAMLRCGTSSFALECISKNGVYVNDQLLRVFDPALKLPDRCEIRFPRTAMRLQFISLLPEHQQNNSPLDVQQMIRLQSSDDLSAAPAQVASPHSSTASVSSSEGINSKPSSHINNKSDGIPPVGSVTAQEPQNTDNDPVVDNHTKTNSKCKPPFSYAQLIVQAIAASADRKVTLSGVYAFITKNYPFFRTADKGWQNSIRHNLSLNRNFVKLPLHKLEAGSKSSSGFWTLDPLSEERLIADAFASKRQKRTSPVSEKSEECEMEQTENSTASSDTHQEMLRWNTWLNTSYTSTSGDTSRNDVTTDLTAVATQSLHREN